MFAKLSQNIVIYGVTNGIKSLVPFIMLPILTAYLSVDDFALLSLVEVSILLLFPLLSLNIASAINVEYFHLNKTELSSYISNAIILSLSMFFIVWGVFHLLGAQLSYYFMIPKMIILWIPVFTLLRVLPLVMLGLLQVQQKAKVFSLFSIGQALLDFGLSYLLVVMYSEGYIGRLEGIYIASFVFSLGALYYLYKRHFFGVFTLKYTKNILTFTLPLIPHVLGGVIIAMSDRYFIAYYESNEQVAYYTVAYQVAAVMLLFSQSINQAWVPVLYGWLKQNKLGLSIKISTLFMGLFIILGILVYLGKDILFYFFVDEKFYIAKEYFVWLLLGFIFQSLYFIVTNFIFYKKDTKYLAILTVSGAMLNMILNYFLIDSFGVKGVAYATAITWCLFFFCVLLMNIFLYRREGFLDKC